MFQRFYGCSALLLALVTLQMIASAQVQRSFVSPGFEQPDISLPPFSSGTYILADESQIPGWNTNAGDNLIEIWETGFGGFTSLAGTQFAEINATQPAGLSQDFCFLGGETVDYSFWHRGRDGIDSIRLLINGSEFTRMGSGNAAWTNYTGSFGIGGSGAFELRFESLFTVGGPASGNFLDEVRIATPLDAFVELDGISFSDLENSGGNIPVLLISGDITASKTVDVIASGGTASGASDYSLSATVTIPPGNYDGTTAMAIPINLTVTNDAAAEGNEDIILNLANPSAGITFMSTSVCGMAGNTSAVYTIIDDETLIYDTLPQRQFINQPLLHDREIAGIKVYPNPFAELTTIRILPGPISGTLEVWDMLGRMRKSVVLEKQEEIQLLKGQLCAGQYLLRVRDENGIGSFERIIIND